MAPRRLEPVASPIHVEVDGERVSAREGEPLAMALAASGRLTLGRSVKYHRPRGAACYAGRCDGCLMRVDGVQSVMTCRLPARDGMVVETQNVIGSAKRDLLAATDWFFRGGMNHHEMFTWNEQVNKAMQKIARRIAGIGTLPDRPAPSRPVEVLEVDALVVGAGPAGLLAATRIASAGRSVLLVDEEARPGGSLTFWPEPIDVDGERDPRALAARMAKDAQAAGARLLSRTSVVGFYDPWEDVAGATDIERPRVEKIVALVDGPDVTLRVRPTRVLLAMGRAEGASAFSGADRPGVISLGAACRMLAHGVLPGERVLLGGDASLEPLARALRSVGATVHGPFELSLLHEARGRPTVTECDVRTSSASDALGSEGVETFACDAVVLAPETSAIYELAAQAGVAVRWSSTGYELDASPTDGATAAHDVRVLGSAANVRALDACLAQADAASQSVLTELAVLAAPPGPRGPR